MNNFLNIEKLINNFMANGVPVLRFKTIAQNKIGNGLPVTMIIP